MNYTTIQITEQTRSRLSELKTASRETYDHLINDLLNLVPSSDDEGNYTPEFKLSLLRGLLDIKHGRTHSVEEVKKQLGIV
ncbi:MAG: hypothetical protein AABX38_05540 [Candidatus Micrarchaeota archaeon]